MKKLPVGIQTFPKLVSDNCCYVDKTPLIHRLMEQGGYYVLSRPRRFGKSLLVSTLKSAFSGEKEFFQGLYLEQHWDWSVHYPVIHVSFGGGVTESREMLDKTLEDILREHAEAYQLELRNQTIAGRFGELIRRLFDKYEQKVVILIDEYDKPILDNLAANKMKTAIAVREGLKNFYSVIKDNDAHIRFALLTGVSKFSKVSLFSGLNNLTDITLDARYATLCGYTENEIKAVFADWLDGVDFDELRAWYNGYNFLGENVYNPYDVLLYLDKREFGNYWFETGSPSFLIRLLQEKQYALPDLERIETSEELLGSFDVEQLTLETLLFQTGYLTIERVENLGGQRFFTLCYPNREVKASFSNYVLNCFLDAPAAKARNQKAVYYALRAGRPQDLRDVFHAFFASIPHDWYRKNQVANYEGYYASIVYGYFSGLGLNVTAEDSTNAGRIDLTVLLEDKVFILEFKVVELDTAPGSALAQIKAKRYSEKYRAPDRTIYLLGVEFSRETRNIVNFEWEIC
ncbi:MAG: ATP-binding protein [Gammaproteobacteria bacterium]|nr:ATP-binding protein [Gammaproteobacteria bacterium]